MFQLSLKSNKKREAPTGHTFKYCKTLVSKIVLSVLQTTSCEADWDSDVIHVLIFDIKWTVSQLKRLEHYTCPWSYSTIYSYDYLSALNFPSINHKMKLVRVKGSTVFLKGAHSEWTTYQLREVWKINVW